MVGFAGEQALALERAVAFGQCLRQPRHLGARRLELDREPFAILHRLAECRRFVARAARRRQERRDPAAGSRPRPPAIGDATPLHPGPPRRPTSSPEGNGLRAGLFPGQEYLQGAAGSSRLAGSLKAAPDRESPGRGPGLSPSVIPQSAYGTVTIVAGGTAMAAGAGCATVSRRS